MAATAPARRPSRAAAAPQPARRPRPDAQPVRRLRVVDDARLKAAHRQRRMRGVVFLASVVAAGLLFALAGFNAMLVTGQGRLDDLERQVADAQAQYSANRLEVARLESPAHIVQLAQQRLGMRPPDGVTYLSPSEAMADEVGDRAVQERPAAEGGDGAEGWAYVKPFLDGQR